MDKSSEKNIFEKYGNGTITDQELLVLYNWYFEQFKSGQSYPDPEIFQKRMEEMDKAIFARLHKNERRTIPMKYVAAAFLLVAASFTFYFILQGINEKKYDAVYAITPGGNKARLTLANGKSIDLTDARTGDLAKQGGVKITKTGDGQLLYTATATRSAGNQYNSIETPNGGKYMVCLPDGTKVWLNAASTLKYPATFSSLSERRVILSGEAYFEVSHNEKQQFIVQTARQCVRDIGTKFNINSYSDEPGIRTTLLEGSVAVIPTLSHGISIHRGSGFVAESILKPGQQSVVSAEGIKISEANAAESISWKNGSFQFRNDDLQTGMRQIARWYDIEVEYDGAVPKDKLYGKVHRDNDLAKVLNMVLGSGISYEIKDRKVIIRSKK
ncbi:FecR family protein [Pedobacter hartonius]|uniref:FecR family protein n=1 Tax=Pedobacter hartonius TaxID=425514 RepID=A0A1H4BN96_9SPHI|nr:FecR family protein [Pedobacter hartonius]SEA49621.1 FecR family protein [Pedobacter hartonius]